MIKTLKKGILLFFITVTFFLSAHTTEIDSLELLLKNGSKIEKHEFLLTNLCSLYWEKSSEIAIKYGEDAIKYCNENNLQGSLPRAYNICGIAYDYAGEYDKSLLYFKKAQYFSKSNKDEIELAESYLNIAIIHKYKSNYDTSLLHLDSALFLFDKLRINTKIADCYNNIGMISQSRGDFGQSLENYKKALNQFDTSIYTKSLANTYNNIGISFSNLEAYDKSAFNYFKALAIYDSLGIAGIRSAMIYNNIANINSKKGDYEKAETYYFAAYNIYKKTSFKAQMASSLYNIAKNSLSMDQIDSALYYYNQAENLAYEIQNKYFIAFMKNGSGEVYMKKGDIKNALSNLHDALKLRNEIGDEKGQTSSNIALAETYLKSKEFSKFSKHIKLAESLAIKNNYKEMIMSINLLYSSYYQLTNNHKLAFNKLEEYNFLKDSLFDQETNKQFSNLQIIYETEKKEQEIENFSLNSLLQEEKIVNQKKKINLFIALILVFIVSTCVVLVLFLKKRAALNQLVIKNRELVEIENQDSSTPINIRIVKQNFDNEVSDTKNEDRELNKTNPTISEDQRKHLINTLQELLEKEKIYLNPEITLLSVSKKMKTNSTYLSKVVNSEYGKSFNNLINKFRIIESRKMLISEEYQNYSIEGISTLVGFKSKSAFNNAFKKYTGLTPSFFKEKALVHA